MQTSANLTVSSAQLAAGAIRSAISTGQAAAPADYSTSTMVGGRLVNVPVTSYRATDSSTAKATIVDPANFQSPGISAGLGRDQAKKGAQSQYDE
jgi:hypothetical protein